MGSHVSTVPNHQTGNVTPLKFRFDLACSGRLGMELQPKSLTPQERSLADRCISSYKEYRDLVFTGDVYRLASPYDGSYYGLMYVSEDKSRAVVFTYCIHYEPRNVGGKSFKLQGLDPSRSYRVTEKNVARSCWWGNGQSFTGEFLASGAFNPVLSQMYSSAVFVLEAE
jgi:alpha-galactosidase